VARKRLLECSFLIPVRRNRSLSDDQRHYRQVWDWPDDRPDQFGGGTRDTAQQEGGYLDRDTGERVSDRSWRYTVAVPSKEVPRLRAVWREACEVFRQKCIYRSIAGQVEFVEGPRHESE
jgi:hypothetical protein